MVLLCQVNSKAVQVLAIPPSKLSHVISLLLGIKIIFTMINVCIYV